MFLPSPPSTTSICRWTTVATARSGCRTRCRTDIGCSSPPTGSRRSTGSSPRSPSRARCSTSCRRGGSTETSRHRRQPPALRARPQRADRPGRRTADGRGRRAGVHHRRHRHGVVDAVRRRRTGALRPSTARWTHEERSARHARSSRRPPRASTAPTTFRCRATTWPSAGSSTPTLWERVQEVALALFDRGTERGAGSGLILADTKYEFGRDHRRRAAADRRGPHTGLVSLVGRIDLRRTGRPAAPNPRASTRRSSGARSPRWATRGDGPVPTLPPEVWAATTARYIDAFERLTGTDFVPGRYPVGPRIHAALAGLEIYS